MEKGQIIRKKLKNGTPVGPYLRITGFVNRFKTQIVLAQSVSGNVEYAIPRDRVYELNFVKMIISDEIVERIIKGRQSAIIHDISTKWCLENLNCAEVVQLRSQKYTQKVIICTVDSVSTVYYNRKPQVRLQLGHIIDHEY